jgi:hypothetical protein
MHRLTLNNTSAHQLLRPRESTRDLRAGRLSFALECVHGRCERRALQIPQRSRHLSPPISPVAPFSAPMMMCMLSRDRPSCTGAPARRQFPRLRVRAREVRATCLADTTEFLPSLPTHLPCGAFWRPHDDVHTLSGSSLMHRCASAASVPAPGVLKRARLKIGCDAHRARRALESYPPLVSSPSSPSQL